MIVNVLRLLSVWLTKVNAAKVTIEISTMTSLQTSTETEIRQFDVTLKRVHNITRSINNNVTHDKHD